MASFQGVSLAELQEELRAWYARNMEYYQRKAWDEHDTSKIKDIYTKLKWIRTETFSRNRDLDLIEDYTEVTMPRHDRHNNDKLEVPKRMLVQGKAGSGKTVFTQMTALGWAKKTVKHLYENFLLLFVVPLGMVTPEKNMFQVILDHNVPTLGRKMNWQAIMAFMERYEENIFVIFDGLDEYREGTCDHIDHCVERRYLGNSSVLMTSRPWKCMDHSLTKTTVDEHFELLGYQDHYDVMYFINMFFEEYIPKFKPPPKFQIDSVVDIVMKDEELPNGKSQLWDALDRNCLHEIMMHPYCAMLVVLMYMDKDKRFHDSPFITYRRLVKFLFKGYQVRAKNDHTPVEHILGKAGAVGLRALLTNGKSLMMEEQDVEDNLGDHPFEFGIVSMRMIRGRLYNPIEVTFMSTPMQEYAAAHHIMHEMDRGNDRPWDQLAEDMTDPQKLVDRTMVLAFACGLSKRACERIITFIDAMIFKIHPDIKNLIEFGEKIAGGNHITIPEIRENCDFLEKCDKVQRLLSLEVQCLFNAGKLDERVLCLADKVFAYKTDPLVMKWSLDTFALKPTNYMMYAEHAEEIKSLATGAKSVAILHLHCRITKEAIPHLSKVLSNNQHPMCVYLDRCKGPKDEMFRCVKELVRHQAPRYVWLANNDIETAEEKEMNDRIEKGLEPKEIKEPELVITNEMRIEAGLDPVEEEGDAATAGPSTSRDRGSSHDESPVPRKKKRGEGERARGRRGVEDMYEMMMDRLRSRRGGDDREGMDERDMMMMMEAMEYHTHGSGEEMDEMEMMHMMEMLEHRMRSSQGEMDDRDARRMFEVMRMHRHRARYYRRRTSDRPSNFPTGGYVDIENDHDITHCYLSTLMLEGNNKDIEQKFFQRLQIFEDLKELCVRIRYNISGDITATQQLLEKLMNLPNLSAMDLSNMNLHDSLLPVLAEILANQSKILRLNLCRCGLSERGVVPICEALARSEKLVSLDLSENSCGKGWEPFFMAALSLSTLNEINLSWCNLPRGCLATLAKLICSCPSLKTVILSGNRSLSKHFHLIADEIPNDASLPLQELNINWCGLHEKDEKALHRFFKKIPNLEKLYFLGNGCETVSFNRRLPKLKVLEYIDASGIDLRSLGFADD